MEWCSEPLRDDTSLVKLAVFGDAQGPLKNADGNALEFASDRLKNDMAVAMMAVKSSGTALKFVSSVLRQDEALY